MENRNHLNKILIMILSLITLMLCCILLCIFFKFRDVTLELGNKVEISDFIRLPGFSNKIKEVTDLSKIDASKVGTHNVKLSFLGKEFKLKLKFIDTTAPVITVQDVSKMKDAEVDVNDFIVEAFDYQDYDLRILSIPKTNEYGMHKIKIEAKDKSKNAKVYEAILYIGWAVREYSLEYGEKISKEDLIFDMANDSETIDDAIIDKINNSPIGDYEITTSKDGNTENIKISIKDTKGPSLNLREKNIYR